MERNQDPDRLAQLPTMHDPRLPLYVRIASVLRTEILAGRLKHGEALPTEAELASRFGAARLTIRRALETLALDRLVVRSPGRGRGTRVNMPTAAHPDGKSMAELLLHFRDPSVRTVLELVSKDIVEAGHAVAARLAIPPEAEVLRLCRRRMVEGRPFSVFTNYCPAAEGRRFWTEVAASLPMLRYLEALGLEITHAEQDITAVVADETSSRLLDCKPGDPLINVRRLAYLRDGRPIEFVSVLYRPTDYNYRVRLLRDHDNDVTLWSVEGDRGAP